MSLKELVKLAVEYEQLLQLMDRSPMRMREELEEEEPETLRTKPEEEMEEPPPTLRVPQELPEAHEDIKAASYIRAYLARKGLHTSHPKRTEHFVQMNLLGINEPTDYKLLITVLKQLLGEPTRQLSEFAQWKLPKVSVVAGYDPNFPISFIRIVDLGRLKKR